MTELPKTPSFSLAGRRALVIGGTSSIGLGCAVALAEAGASVIIMARHKDMLDDVISAMMTAGFTAEGIVADISDIEAMKAAIMEIRPLDIFVNSAGMARHSPAIDTDPAQFDAISNGGVREKLADWYCEYAGLKYTKMRNISALSRGDTPGPDASITKIVSANKLQDIANFGMDLMDNASIIKSDDKDDIRALFQGSLLGAPLIRIAGGTDEILRNIIAEQVLGMPQDVRVDKTVPFNEIPSGSKN